MCIRESQSCFLFFVKIEFTLIAIISVHITTLFLTFSISHPHTLCPQPTWKLVDPNRYRGLYPHCHELLAVRPLSRLVLVIMAQVPASLAIYRFPGFRITTHVTVMVVFVHAPIRDAFVVEESGVLICMMRVKVRVRVKMWMRMRVHVWV